MQDDRSAGEPAGDEGTTLTEVLAHYEQNGFMSAFSPQEHAHVRCDACGRTTPAAGVTMTSLRRLEGASDPDDMLAVAALTCPHCGARGTVTLGYGPSATLEDADVLRALRDRRGEAELPRDAAPGESITDT